MDNLKTIRKHLETKKFFNGTDLILVDYYVVLTLNNKNEVVSKYIIDVPLCVIA